MLNICETIELEDIEIVTVHFNLPTHGGQKVI